MIPMARNPTYEKLAQRVLELEKAEKVLRESEQRYRRLTENSPDMIYRMSLPDGKYEYVSPAATDIFGYPPEEWYDNPLLIREIIHPDCHSYFEAQWKNLLKGNVVPIYEYKIIHKDQSIRWINQRNMLVKNDTGCPEAIEGVVTDMTDRKREEGMLQKSKERFSMVMEATMDGLWDWNVSSDEVYFSPGYSAMLGYASSEVPAHIRFWMDLIHPEDVDAALKVNRDCIENRCEQFKVEYRMRAKNGEWRWILGRGKAVARDKEGRAVRMIGTHTDITERKLAEEQLRVERWRLQSIIEGTPGGTWEWNVQTEELVVNEMWARTLGYTLDELSPFSNNLFKTMVHPDDLEQCYTLLNRHFAGELPYYSCEFRMKHKKGHWTWIQDNGRLITRTADGKPLMMFGTHTDISDRKLAEERIKQNLMEKETLLREIHHRVKNNLAVITGLIALQANRIQDENIKQIFDVCQHRIKSMSLVHEKIYQSENLSAVNFSEYINSIANDLLTSFQLGKRKINIRVSAQDIFLDIDTAIPCGLIINELITNALKHAFAETIHPELSIGFEKADNAYTLTVQDNGIGLPDGDCTSAANTLGLKLVHSLTRQLRGTVLFYVNAPGRPGTTAIVAFKAKEGTQTERYKADLKR